MEVKEITSKQEWEEFVLLCDRKTFLQSWNWADFHVSLGNNIWRFGIYEGTDLVSVALVIKIPAKRGAFLLVPHGPLTNNQNTRYNNQILGILVEKLKELGREEGVDFIRISPIWQRSDPPQPVPPGRDGVGASENTQIFKSLGFRQGALHYHPESSWKLNIGPTEDELLAGMRKTTRYLLKQAWQNKDIEIVKSTDVKDLETFYTIHKEVVKVQKFVPFSLEYLQKEFLAFSQDNAISLFLARYQGTVIAGSFQIFWSNMAFYHHAGLLPEYKKIPVSYLIQWEAIKEAKKRGCKVYDFWGYADPVKNPKHPYSGPTLFKMGFGGYKDEYVKTQDLPLSKKYWITYAIETLRKIKRGL